MQKPSKAAFKISRINFCFVTLFYYVYDICTACFKYDFTILVLHTQKILWLYFFIN